jgi:hypothetical protein
MLLPNGGIGDWDWKFEIEKNLLLPHFTVTCLPNFTTSHSPLPRRASEHPPIFTFVKKWHYMLRFLHLVLLLPLFVSASDTLVRKQITVAYIFPFNASKVYVADLEESKYAMPDETQIAIEFFQGAQLAFDSLARLGLSSRHLLFDSGTDSTSIQKMLRDPQLAGADLIFAPFGGYVMNNTVEFGKRNKIPVISPLSVSPASQDTNHYLILANASMKCHLDRLAQWVLQEALTHRTLLVYRKSNDEKLAAAHFKKALEQMKAQGRPAPRLVEITDSSKGGFARLRDSLYIIDINHVVIPSNEEAFVRSILRQLYSIRETHSSVVYGLPSWKNMRSIPPEQFDSLNAVITGSFCLDTSSQAVGRFKSAYREKFGMNPTEYSVRGFDQALYFINAWSRNSNTAIGPPANQLASCFDFTPCHTAPLSCSYFENRNTLLMGRKNGQWITLDK